MTKKKSTTARKNAVVERTNEGGIGPRLDWQDQWQMTTGRYADPLIVRKIHNKQIAEMREIVAEADPVASVLTHLFAEGAWAKMPKFYASDQLDAPEIMQDLRAMLKVFKLQEYGKEVFLRGQTHGWYIIYPFVDEETQIPKVEIYSEFECEPLRIHYDLNNNIQWYQIHYIPRVGFNRVTALRAVNRKFTRDQVIHGTRGTWRYGFGFSILEGSWDAITKLREESHTNAFKQKIMPFVRVPDSWSKEQIDNFMAALAKIDMMSAMVMKAPLNEITGEYQDLPAITWATPANNTPTKSSQGSGGSVSDLSSEWSRLTAATRRSVAYFVGGGALSASRAAAGVDSLDDLDMDIQDFNQYIDEFIIPFVKWFAAVIGYTLPDTFTVKGWWEWTRDEAMYAKIQTEQQKQLQNFGSDQPTDHQGESDSKNNKALGFYHICPKCGYQNYVLRDSKSDFEQCHKCGYGMYVKDKRRNDLLDIIKTMAQQQDHWPEEQAFQARLNQKQTLHPEKTLEECLMEVVGEITQEHKINAIRDQILVQYQNAIKPDYTDLQRMEVMVTIVAANRHNIIPNTIVPVNSISGNTEYVMLEQPQDQAEALWVKFKDPYGWYRYQERGEDMVSIADHIYQQGGEAVWSDLRGLGNAPRDEKGHLPKGIPRAPAASMNPAPLAGRPHDAYGIPYQGFGSQGPKGALFGEMVAKGREELEAELQPKAPNEPEQPIDVSGLAAPEATIEDYAGMIQEQPTPIEAKPSGEKESEPTQMTSSTTPDATITDMTPRSIAQPKFLSKLKGLFTKALTKKYGGKAMGLAGASDTYKSVFGESKSNIGLPLIMDEEYAPSLEMHPLLQEYSSIYGIRKNLHIGDEKAKRLLDEEDKECQRWNLAALATAMHTSNPFIYKMGDGYRVEYICPDSLRQLDGVEVPYGLWHNLDDEEKTTLPDWQIIGTYKVAIDGEKDVSQIHYADDWEEKATKVIDRLKQTAYYRDPIVKNWVDNYIDNVKQGIHGDVSTGIVTDVKYNKEKNKWVQTNIKLNSVSAVPIGNCSTPYCTTKNL